MRNKRYLIGFLIYGLLCFGLIALETAIKSSFLNGIMWLVLGSIALVPVVLAWLVSCNLRIKNYKFTILWSSIFTGLLLFSIVFGVYSSGLSLKVEDEVSFLLYGFVLLIPLYPVGITIHRLLKKDYRSAGKWGLASVVIGGLLVLVIWSSITPTGPPAADAERVSDLRRIKLALKLYYLDHGEYPTALDSLITENYLKESDIIRDNPRRDPSSYFYNYAYGIDKKSGMVKYYHLGAVLSVEKRDDFLNDQDYSSLYDSPNIDWRPDSKNPGPCLTADGFNGADDNNCGLSDRGGVYDRGVFPE